MIRPRQALILAVLAVHAAFVASGAGLHALPGLAHASGGRIQGADPSQATVSASGDDCPVCHFLAQGQSPIDRADGPPQPVEADRPEPDPAPRALAPERLLTRLRAPPLSSLHSA